MKKSKKTFLMHDDYNDAGETVVPETGEAAGLSERLDEVVQGLSGAKPAGQVYLVDTRQLEAYPNQPFKQYTPERLRELADDIGRVGVLSPILTRRHKNKLQILAGHNRWTAAGLAGLSQVPVLILEADDDQAVLIMTGTNLRQRETLLPSEKALAYKLQMEALKRQGQRDAGGQPYIASTLITSQTGDSRMQIHRYVRLAGLLPELLELLDRGRISMTPAVAVSYLGQEEQAEVLRCVRDRGASLSIEKGNTLKALAAEGKTTLADIRDILLGDAGEKKRPKAVRVPYDRIAAYLPPDLDVSEVEDWIIKALREFKPEKK